MSIFFQWAPAAIFAGTFMKTLFTSAATAHGTLMAFVIYLKIKPSAFLEILVCIVFSLLR